MSITEVKSGSGWGTLISASAATVVVGYVSTILVVMQGSAALGASVAQQASTAAATCFGMAITSLYLGWRHKIPIVIAWSTPGSALLASSAGALVGISYAEALGAFVCAGLLMVLTALIRPLAQAIERMPAGIAAAMLAGVLFKFVLAVPVAAVGSPWLVVPLVLLYFGLRMIRPLAMYAVPIVVAAGVALALATGDTLNAVPLTITPLVFEMPVFHWQAIISIGVPLYLVTMASQNLPGFAVLRAIGYQPPVASCLTVTGIGSALCAPFGTHAINMAAITAALAAGPDAHADPAQRWKVIFPYFIMYMLVGFAAATSVATLGALPADIVAAIAGLALFGPMAGGVAAMMKEPKDTEAALATFVVTASGIALFGIGAAFWGLVAGLILWGVKRLVAEV